MTEPLLWERLSSLGFYQRHFKIIDNNMAPRELHNHLQNPGTVGFWLSKDVPALIAIVTLLTVESDRILVAVWFYEKLAEGIVYSDYFAMGGGPGECVQVWPIENERLRKVLRDAIAMETLGARSPLRAY